ncbi:uncharacterized protein J5F26_000718 [Ciconia maguari]
MEYAHSVISGKGYAPKTEPGSKRGPAAWLLHRAANCGTYIAPTSPSLTKRTHKWTCRTRAAAEDPPPLPLFCAAHRRLLCGGAGAQGGGALRTPRRHVPSADRNLRGGGSTALLFPFKNARFCLGEVRGCTGGWQVSAAVAHGTSRQSEAGRSAGVKGAGVPLRRPELPPRGRVKPRQGRVGWGEVGGGGPGVAARRLCSAAGPIPAPASAHAPARDKGACRAAGLQSFPRAPRGEPTRCGGWAPCACFPPPFPRVSRHAQLRQGESSLREPCLKDTRVRGERRRSEAGREEKEKRCYFAASRYHTYLDVLFGTERKSWY